MSKREAREFKERWKFVNTHIANEIRNTPAEIKLQQLQTLFNSARLFRCVKPSEEVDAVRARWIRLKKKAHV